MKKALYIFVGSLVFLGIGVLTTAISSNWVAERFIRSDDDMNTIGKIIFLGVYPSLIILGGWVGDHMFKYQTRRTKGCANKQRAPEL